MRLKRNEEIKIRAWYNDQLLVNDDWLVFSEDGNEQFFIFVKDGTGENQLKIRIEKSQKTTKSEEKSTESENKELVEG